MFMLINYLNVFPSLNIVLVGGNIGLVAEFFTQTWETQYFVFYSFAVYPEWKSLFFFLLIYIIP